MFKNKCTIIVPLFNRPMHLKRLLTYYNYHKINHQLIIADSSSLENKKIAKKITSQYPNLDILYLGSYPSDINQYHKLADAIDYAKEEYCLQMGEDDFIAPSGINYSIEFLKNNSDYTVVHGKYISFNIVKKGERYKFYWQPIYPHDSITFPDAVTRFKYHLLNYHGTLYGVHRTDLLKKVYKDTFKYTNDYRFGELLPSMLALIYGKMKCLDIFYCAREITTNSATTSTRSIKDFLNNGSYNKKYKMFRNCLIENLNNMIQLEMTDAINLIDESMYSYLYKYNLLTSDSNFITNKYKQLKMTIKRHSKLKKLILYFKYYNHIDNIRHHVLIFCK